MERLPARAADADAAGDAAADAAPDEAGGATETDSDDEVKAAADRARHAALNEILQDQMRACSSGAYFPNDPPSQDEAGRGV